MVVVVDKLIAEPFRNLVHNRLLVKELLALKFM